MGHPGFQQLVHERTVDRHTAVTGRFAGVHHQLLPERPSLIVGVRQPMRPPEQLAAPFAYPHPLDGQQRPRCDGAELGDHRGNLRRGPDRDDHQRNVDIAAEESSPVTLAVRGAVDTQKDCTTGESLSIQEIAHCAVCGQSADTLLAAHIDRELDRVVGADVEQVIAADQTGPFQCDQTVAGHRDHLVDQAADLRLDVDRGDRHRRVLGQAQRLVGT